MIAHPPAPTIELAETKDSLPTTLAGAIESDRRYFEMGARIDRLPGAELAWMPGLSRAPAAVVIHRVVPEVVAAVGPAWAFDAERALRRIGAPMARIYLDRPGTAADSVLHQAGYASRRELVFAGDLRGSVGVMTLRRLRDDGEWRRKLRFHEETPERPDGHNTAASDWVRLERAKCAAGMQAFLAEVDGKTVGAIGLVRSGRLLRMKNIAIHPAFRRRGFGLAMLRSLAALGRSMGLSTQCILAVEGEVGERLYRAAGLDAIGAQVEWSKTLSMSNDATPMKS